MTRLVTDPHLRWINLINTTVGILGLALVYRGYEAPLHHHVESETYYLLLGDAKMWLNGKVQSVSAPSVLKIPSNIPHALTPVSKWVLLAYWFPRGPFTSIEYKWLDKEPPLLARL